MINPHGADELKPLYVEDESARAQLQEDAGSLPAIVVSSAAAASAVMLGSVGPYGWLRFVESGALTPELLPNVVRPPRGTTDADNLPNQAVE